MVGCPTDLYQGCDVGVVTERRIMQRRLCSYLGRRSLDIRKILQDRISSAISLSFGSNLGQETRLSVTSISNIEFGHYQCVSAMPLAKELKMKPHDVAMKIFENLDTKDLIESTEVAGPGFMNLRCNRSPSPH